MKKGFRPRPSDEEVLAAEAARKKRVEEVTARIRQRAEEERVRQAGLTAGQRAAEDRRTFAWPSEGGGLDVHYRDE